MIRAYRLSQLSFNNNDKLIDFVHRILTTIQPTLKLAIFPTRPYLMQKFSGAQFWALVGQWLWRDRTFFKISDDFWKENVWNLDDFSFWNFSSIFEQILDSIMQGELSKCVRQWSISSQSNIVYVREATGKKDFQNVHIEMLWKILYVNGRALEILSKSSSKNFSNINFWRGNIIINCKIENTVTNLELPRPPAKARDSRLVADSTRPPRRKNHDDLSDCFPPIQKKNDIPQRVCKYWSSKIRLS